MKPRRAWLAPVVLLFGLAVVVRAVAAAGIVSTASENSAYYVGVARNLLNGHGLVSNAMWSYATPPLVLPEPAFALWMPMATFLAAVPMVLFGQTFAAAQWSTILLGAAIAPLTWLVAGKAAASNGLAGRRAATVAWTAGLLAATLGAFVTASAVPDSTTPFLVFGVAAALLMPSALGARSVGAHSLGARSVGAPLALGICLGLAYLSRSEAVWLGLTFVVLYAAARSSTAASAGSSAARPSLGRNLVPVAIGGLIVVAPWLLRNAMTFGSPFAGQALQNALITRNEEIFAYAQPPSPSGFLSQGIVGIVGHVGVAAVYQLVDVLLVQAFPVGLIGLVALIAMRRSRAVRQPGALQALLIAGGLTFVATALLFPVATLWGTFLHAAGPLLAAFCVMSALGLDAVVARARAMRHWSHENAWLAAAALLSLAVPVAAFESLVVSLQSYAQQDRVAAAAAAASQLPEVQVGGPVISDHPVWLSDALGIPVIALPDESPGDVDRLVNAFGAKLIVVVDSRGRYPNALVSDPDRPCTFGLAVPLGNPARPTWFVRILPGCAA